MRYFKFDNFSRVAYDKLRVAVPHIQIQWFGINTIAIPKDTFEDACANEVVGIIDTYEGVEL